MATHYYSRRAGLASQPKPHHQTVYPVLKIAVLIICALVGLATAEMLVADPQGTGSNAAYKLLFVITVGSVLVYGFLAAIETSHFGTGANKLAFLGTAAALFLANSVNPIYLYIACGVHLAWALSFPRQINAPLGVQILSSVWGGFCTGMLFRALF